LFVSISLFFLEQFLYLPIFKKKSQHFLFLLGFLRIGQSA